MVIAEFLPLVGRTLVVDCDPDAVELTLIEATPRRDDGVADRPPFILVFRSSPEILLLDGIYAMRGHGFGPDLVSISSLMKPPRSEPGYYYQAVFN